MWRTKQIESVPNVQMCYSQSNGSPMNQKPRRTHLLCGQLLVLPETLNLQLLTSGAAVNIANIICKVCQQVLLNGGIRVGPPYPW